MRIVVTGLMGQFPFGGVIWDYLQYLLGFRGLGHDVWYLEDCGTWPYDPVQFTYTEACEHNVAFLTKVMSEFNLGDRWIYRNGATGEWYGAGEKAARELVEKGDVLVDVSGASWLRDYAFGRCHRMFVDGDPVFNHLALVDGKSNDTAARIRAFDSHFTFGLNVGEADSTVPTAGIHWHKTVQPIALECFPYDNTEPLDRFTTVMNWTSYASREYQGESYGQKDIEFMKFRELPRHTPQKLVMAMGKGSGNKRPTEELRALGWEILEPDIVVPDHHTYRDFLRTSKGEWSVAKNGYVKARTGWFSCRSACYLALGRPVVVQDTGWTRHIPPQDGCLAFATLEEAVAGLAAVNADYERHRRGARKLAETKFESKAVCHDMLAQVGLA